MSSETIDERVTDEIEALGAILLDNELKIKENDRGIPEYIETVVFPSTGEDSQSQYVCVTLVVHLPTGYPDISPLVHLENPRGLDENTVKLIQTETDAKCRDFLGQPVMFELIELVREHLTRSNLPTGQCAVCLYGFQDGDEFTKTECYHHFHSHCLAAHVVAAERYHTEELEKLPQWQQDSAKPFQAICPVCRESIHCDVENLCLAPPPIDVEAATDFCVTAELRELQRRMSTLFTHQQQRGGIIDPEAEGIKMLLRTDENPRAEAESPSPPAGPSLTNFSAQSTANMRATSQQHCQQFTDQKSIKHQNSSDLENDKQNDLRQSQNHRHPHHSHHHHHYHGRRNRGRGGGGGSSGNRRNNDRFKQSETAPR
ncbi:hypothetical protein PV327_006635 [Microctonus hyperodae]|uniref:E3 ubiquitin-protein ligase RNF25 n=1 Tax=Microctonus hyperodae TaxID=165561 RepID=A0AA39F4N6_MICHY|nr:hypothetical protein PV327_006635 [Microctonus hyperodae]